MANDVIGLLPLTDISSHHVFLDQGVLTTVASPGVGIPPTGTYTLPITDCTGVAASGEALVVDAFGIAAISYTGRSASSGPGNLTGCKGGIAGIATGTNIQFGGPASSLSSDDGHTAYALALSGFLGGAAPHPGEYLFFSEADTDGRVSFSFDETTLTQTDNRVVLSVRLDLWAEYSGFPGQITAFLDANDGSFTLGSTVLTPLAVGTAGSPKLLSSTTYTQKTIGSTLSALTVANVNKMRATLLQSSGFSEVRIYAARLTVVYNDAPSATPTLAGLSGGVILNAPAFSWTYTDPENDPQYAYRIVVFSHAAATAGSFDPNDISTWPTPGTPDFPYDSGNVVSSNTSADISLESDMMAVLKGNTGYRSYLLVTDRLGTGPSGVDFQPWQTEFSSNRYNVLVNTGAGGANGGIDFTIKPEPLLMPALEFPTAIGGDPATTFDPVAGSLGPIATRLRSNLLPSSDADFLNAACSANSLGTWSLTLGTSLTGDSSGYSGGRGILTANGAVSAAENAAFPVSPGDIVTVTLKVKGNATDTPTAAIGLGFLDASASPLGEHFSPPIALPTTATSTRWTTVFVSLRVPVNAATAVAIVSFGGCTSGHLYSFSCASVTPGAPNLLDDASMEDSGVFWETGSLAGGTVAHETGPPAPGPSWGESSVALRAARTGAGTCCAHPESLLAAQISTPLWLFGADVYPVSAGTIRMGYATPAPTSGSDFPISITDAPPVGAWKREEMEIAGGSGVANGMPAILPADPQTIVVDNASLEMVWPFVDGDFETITAGTAIPDASPLGWPNTGGTTFDGQYWERADAGTGTLTVSSAQHHTGTRSANLHCGATDPSVVLEQIFTVSGLLTLTVDWWWMTTHVSPFSHCEIDFYDAAGINLGGFILDGYITGTNAWAAAASTVNVPTNAAYARLQYVNAGSDNGTNASDMFVDDVVLSSTGTMRTSRPFLDGGWSEGGGLPGTITVQRSDGVIPFTDLRQPPNGAVPVPTSGEIQSFLDYEYPGNDRGVSQSLYYRAQGSVLVAAGGTRLTPYSPDIVATNAGGFVISGAGRGDWLLVDPRYPADNCAIQVKTAQFQTDENQQAFVPLGRGRRVIIGDTLILGDTITLALQTILASEWAALRKQMLKVYPLLLRSPDGEMWYVRFTKRQRERVWHGTYDVPHRTFTVTLEQVDAIA